MSSSSDFHRYPFYSPRFWHGMRPATWWSLLSQGHFAVHWSRLPMLLGVSGATPFNAAMAGLQKLWRRQDLADAELMGPPIFIVGHWRSGTTLLHELMVRDERFASPSTFQCFAPHHFLVTEWWFQKFGGWLMPKKRPMDNMAAGWERPQEDEFALMNLGLPSPYRRIAFPNRGPVHSDYLDFRGVPEADIEHWCRQLRRFLETVSIACGRPLVVKSPTHTGRIGMLAKAFPEAKFVHISRDPRSLYPSTIRLWRSLDDGQALQRPNHEQLHDYVLQCFERMYASYFNARTELVGGRLFELRYEDLVREPTRTLSELYHLLHLADFDTVRPSIEAWAADEHRSYQTNRHQLSASIEAELKQRWKPYFEAFAYE